MWQTLCLPIRVRQVTACSTSSCWVWWQLIAATEVIPLGLLELQAFQKWCKTFLGLSLGAVPDWRELMDASPSVRSQDINHKTSTGPQVFLIIYDKNWCDIVSQSIDHAAIDKYKPVDCSSWWQTSSPWPTPLQVASPPCGHNLETGGLHCCYLGIIVNLLQALWDYPFSPVVWVCVLGYCSAANLVLRYFIGSYRLGWCLHFRIHLDATVKLRPQ